jgi:hypothetical protein
MQELAKSNRQETIRLLKQKFMNSKKNKNW